MSSAVAYVLRTSFFTLRAPEVRSRNTLGKLNRAHGKLAPI